MRLSFSPRKRVRNVSGHVFLIEVHPDVMAMPVDLALQLRQSPYKPLVPGDHLADPHELPHEAMYGVRAPALTSHHVRRIVIQMKTASIREVQHNLNRVLAWVAGGETVGITRRREMIARLVPAKRPRKTLPHPDYAERLRRAFPKGVPPGKPASRLLADDRERF